jgi:hypothetical protein
MIVLEVSFFFLKILSTVAASEGHLCFCIH